MVDPVVRPATAADGPQLAALEQEARTALVGQRGAQRWFEHHRERGGDWATWVADGPVYAASIDDVLVGYLVASHSGGVARIEEIYVTPGARELGFGDALLELAMTTGRDAGCTTIEGEALPGDRDTKNLYERAGITASLIVVSRAL